MTPAIFLMGVGPMARWKQAGIPDLARRLRVAFGVSVATAVVLPLAMPGPLRLGSPMIMLGLWLAGWSVASAAAHARQRRTDGDGHWRRRLGRQPRAWRPAATSSPSPVWRPSSGRTTARNARYFPSRATASRW
ncbi:hypothetical protein G6F58_013077 [Rhizopus delemar]|nr:hypothetical protein G6F58_013077 [Rhizopus delemar]